MSEPLAKFFDSDVKPPRSGWRATVGGREFAGHSENDVFNEVKRWRQNNNTFSSDDDITRELWDFWRANEPNRSTVQQMPSNRQMARNVLKSAVQTVKAAVTGQPVVATGTQAEQRMEICQQCPRMVIQSGVARCSACGCFLNYKTALSQEKCPLSKWPQ